MKSLVIYYSFEGNTRVIAENIAEAIQADILELKPVKDLTTKGFMKYVWGGRQVVMKEKPQLQPLDKDPNDYDVLFIGTPVWAFTYAPALNAFFSDVKLNNKRIVLFCTHTGAMLKTFENMRKVLNGNNIIGEKDINCLSKKNKDERAGKAKKWAEVLYGSV